MDVAQSPTKSPQQHVLDLGEFIHAVAGAFAAEAAFLDAAEGDFGRPEQRGVKGAIDIMSP
jgi:hypothetical protein